MNYYPIINKNVIKVKLIDDKTIIFLKELNEKKIILNNTAKAIFDSCDGNNSLCEIIKINAGDCGLKKQQNKDIMEILKNLMIMEYYYGDIMRILFLRRNVLII